jgi:curved DNA-binding protein
MFGGDRNSGSSNVKFRGQDYHSEYSINLKEITSSQKHSFKINNRNIRLTVPAGIENGQVIRINGLGGPGTNGGPNGDLYIRFQVLNDTHFRRDKSDLYTDIDLDLYKAVLGGEITVDTLNGKVKLTVKPGTQNMSRVKLKNKGLPVYKKEGKFGDLYITYHIKIPEKLSEQEIELFKKLSSIKPNGN